MQIFAKKARRFRTRPGLAGRPYAAIALAHCGCGQAQRSLVRPDSAASEQAWLQYFSPAETEQVHPGWAQRLEVLSGICGSSGLESRFFRCNGKEISKFHPKFWPGGALEKLLAGLPSMLLTVPKVTEAKPI